MADPVQTGMRIHQAIEWLATGHIKGTARNCDHFVPVAQIILRRVGWLDQKGQVWLSVEDWMTAGEPNGSITPLLISVGCD